MPLHTYVYVRSLAITHFNKNVIIEKILYFLLCPSTSKTTTTTFQTFSLVTGAVALVFSAIGVLSSGLFISKYRPNARFMAAWNVFGGALGVFGIISYIFLGCADNERAVSLNYTHE